MNPAYCVSDYEYLHRPSPVTTISKQTISQSTFPGFENIHLTFHLPVPSNTLVTQKYHANIIIIIRLISFCDSVITSNLRSRVLRQQHTKTERIH